MNFDRSLIFAYLEEDNIQRAYFRVRPLLTMDGDVRQEALALWPNEGGLRIVPDRNEQHSFKMRMRTLGSYCVVDLRGLPAEAGKIRTNKNFHPDRGEVNQYILYSDTVHELPEHTFYQLMDGSIQDYAAFAEKAITPLFYIRDEDTLYGPVKKANPAQPQPAQEAAGVLFELPCPDGVTRNILCLDAAGNQETASKNEKIDTPKEAESAPVPQVAETVIEPSPQESPAEEPPALPIGEELHILDENQAHEDTLQQLNKPVSSGANLLHEKEKPVAVPEPVNRSEPLTGTPLIRTPLHVSVQQTKNRTQEVVSNQWVVGKYESPAQNLPAHAKLRAVENPVETACSYLREAWNASSSHDYLTNFILSLDGVRNQLETKLCDGKTGTIMQHVLQQRLQDLEAERLSALCELDKAKRDVDAFKQELLTGMSNRINREIGQLENDKQAAQTLVDALKKETNALMLQRDALIAKVNELQNESMPEAVAKLLADAQMTTPVTGTPLRLSPVSGSDVELDELISRLLRVCADSGVAIDRNAAVAMLVLMAVSPRIGVSCATTAAASTLLKNIAYAMGWQNSYAHQFASEQHPVVGMRPVDSTPALLTTSLPNYAPITGATKLTLSRNTNSLVKNAAYDVCQWPIWLLPNLPFVPEMDAVATPVSAASVVRLAEHQAVSTAELDAVLAPVLRAATPLSGAAQKELYKFVSICAGLMDGGLPAAADWGILLWVIPAVEHGSKHYAAVKATLDEYPLSLAKL